MTKYRAEVEMPDDNPVFQLREVYLATDVEVEWEQRKALILQLRIMLLTMAITLAMVLWVVPWARADDLTAPGNCSINIDGHSSPRVNSQAPYQDYMPIRIQRDTPEKPMLDEASDPARCLAMMEAAMRAMEPFLPSEMPIIVTDDLIYRNQLARAEREVERLTAQADALRQWEQAAACWRRP